MKVRFVAAVLCLLGLGGCAIPLPIQVASWALDGLSFLATRKSVSDHGISIVAQRDCAMFRTVTEGQPCRDEPDDEPYEVAASPDTVGVDGADGASVTASLGALVSDAGVDGCALSKVAAAPEETYYLLATFASAEAARDALDDCAAPDRPFVFARILEDGDSRLIVGPVKSGARSAVLEAVGLAGYRRIEAFMLTAAAGRAPS